MSAFDDYLNAPTQQAAPSFDAYLGAPVPASAAGGTGAAPVQTAAGQPNLNPPPLGGFMTGVGDAVKGTTQALVHGIAWGANKIAPDSQFAKDANASLPQMQAAIDQQNQAYAAQRAASGGSGFDPMRTLGNIAGTAPSMALGPEFAGLSLPAKIGVGAMQGAAGAGMMPASAPTDGNSYAQQKLTQMGVGGALGAAAPLAFASASAAGKGLWNVAQPVFQPGKFVGQGLSGAMDLDAAAQAASNIRNARSYIDGSYPTTAQATNNPVLVQTEKALRSDPNSGFGIQFANRQTANNVARDASAYAASGDPKALGQQIDQFNALQNSRLTQGAQSLPPAGAPTLAIPTPNLTTPEFLPAVRQARAMAQNEGSSAFSNLDLSRTLAQSSPQQQVRAFLGSQDLAPLGAPTTGLAAPNLATPEFAPILRRAQAIAQNDGNTAFTDQSQRVNSGLLGQLRSITGEPSDLEAAQAARSAAAADNFLSTNIGIPVSNTDYVALKQTPAFRSAFSQAQNMARNEGVSSIETQVQNRANANLGGAIGAPQTYVSGQGLQYVKSALDDQIGAASRAGENAQAKNLMGVKTRLLSIMDGAIPGYADARQAYAQASRPIDAMSVLQSKNLVDMNGNVSPSKIDSLINGVTATQQRPGFRAADSVTPAQLSSLTDLKANALNAPTNLLGLSGVGQDYLRNAAEQGGTPEAQAALQNYLKSSSPNYQHYFGARDANATLQSSGALFGLSGEGQDYVRQALEAKGTPEAQAAYQQYLKSSSPHYQQYYDAQAGEGSNLNSAKALADGLAVIHGNTSDEAVAPTFGIRNVAQLERQPLVGPQADFVSNLKKDVLREQLSNQKTVMGSDTHYNAKAEGWLARQLYGPAFNGASGVGKAVGAVGAMVSGHPMAALGILGAGNKIGQFVGGRLNQRLGNYMLDPQSLLPYLDARAASAAGQTGPGAAMQGLLNYGRPAAVNGLLGNFLNPSQ